MIQSQRRYEQVMHKTFRCAKYILYTLLKVLQQCTGRKIVRCLVNSRTNQCNLIYIGYG